MPGGAGGGRRRRRSRRWKGGGRRRRDRRTVALVHAGKAGRVSAVRLWFGSWLPDWRPNVDYRTTYSARANLGGGVLLDAIHELDLCLWLLGGEPVDVIGAVVGRFGPLE